VKEAAQVPSEHLTGFIQGHKALVEQSALFCLHDPSQHLNKSFSHFVILHSDYSETQEPSVQVILSLGQLINTGHE
jgi:hypothetical protein